MADEPDPEKKEPKDSPFVIHIASFTKGYPFETRQGAFHSYTYLPFLGWLDPIALNVIIFGLVLVLAVIVPPLAGRAARKRAEKATLEGLTAMRRDMAQFNRDTTWTPIPPEAMVRAGRMDSVPKAALLPYHGESDAVLEAAAPDDSGGWRFDRTGNDPARMVFVNCTHTDRQGKPWAGY